MKEFKFIEFKKNKTPYEEIEKVLSDMTPGSGQYDRGYVLGSTRHHYRSSSERQEIVKK